MPWTVLSTYPVCYSPRNGCSGSCLSPQHHRASAWTLGSLLLLLQKKPTASSNWFQKQQKLHKYSLCLTCTFHMLSKGFWVARPKLHPVPSCKGVSVPFSFPGSAVPEDTWEGNEVDVPPTSSDNKGGESYLGFYCCKGPRDLVQLVNFRDQVMETQRLNDLLVVGVEIELRSFDKEFSVT